MSKQGIFNQQGNGQQTNSPTANRNSTQSYNMEVSQPLDVKDLSIIEDQLMHEALAFKKWSVYSTYFQDTQLSSMAQDIATHHKQHFDSLQGYLNSRR